MTDKDYSKLAECSTLAAIVRDGVIKLLPYIKDQELLETATDALVTGVVKIPPSIVGVTFKPRDQAAEYSVYYALVALKEYAKHGTTPDSAGRLRFSSYALPETLIRYVNGYYER